MRRKLFRLACEARSWAARMGGTAWGAIKSGSSFDDANRGSRPFNACRDRVEPSAERDRPEMLGHRPERRGRQEQKRADDQRSFPKQEAERCGVVAHRAEA